MISNQQTTADIQPEPLLCSKSRRQVTLICTTEGCQSHPLMCNDDECQCQAPHEEHLCSIFKGVVRKIDRAAVVPEEVKRTKVLVARVFDDIVKRVHQEWDRINRFLERDLRLESKYEDMRSSMLGRSNLGNEITGSTAYAMLCEMEEQSKVQPTRIFALAVEEMEAEA